MADHMAEDGAEDETEEQTNMKLPVWRTAKAAYLVIVHNPGLAVKLCAVPFALTIIQGLVTAWLWGGQDLAAFTQNGPAQAAVFGMSAVVYLSMVPTITAWHRLALIGHGVPDARIHYSIRSSEWLYLWKGFLFVLLMTLISIPALVAGGSLGGIIGAAFQGGPRHSGAGILIAILAVLAVQAFLCACVLRFNLVFPAAAIGDTMGFRESWRRTRGNTWRLFGVAVLTVAPFLLIPTVLVLMVFGFKRLPTVTEQALVGLLHAPFWIIGLCVGISFWSWSYRYLVQEAEIDLPS
jgi:hypothetical protein